MGDKIHETVKRSIEDFVAFAVEFTIRNTLKAPEAEAVLKDMLILKMMTTTPSHDYYIQRFAGLDKDISRWRQAGQEYLMAGIAFGEACGKTGNPEADNLIKQFGATVFAQVFEITKKELRRVRINL